MKKKNIDKIIYIQRVWKNTMLYKQDIESEIIFFTKSINIIIDKLEFSYRNNLIQNIEYQKSSELIDYCNSLLSFFPDKISLLFLSSNSKFKILSNLAKIKLSLIEISNLVGSMYINDIVKLYTGISDTNKLFYGSYQKLYNYINDFFFVTKVNLYTKDDDDPLKYNIYNYNKNKIN